MTVTLRDLTEADLTWVAQREVEIFGAAAWSQALIRDDFRYGGKRYRGALLDRTDAERGGEEARDLVAYAIYGYDGDAFHLMNLAVVPQARRRGVARALMDDFFAEARAQGAPDAWLEVAVTNDSAIELYRAYGFEDVRIRPRYYQPENVDALVMRARL